MIGWPSKNVGRQIGDMSVTSVVDIYRWHFCVGCKYVGKCEEAVNGTRACRLSLDAVSEDKTKDDRDGRTVARGRLKAAEMAARVAGSYAVNDSKACVIVWWLHRLQSGPAWLLTFVVLCSCYWLPLLWYLHLIPSQVANISVSLFSAFTVGCG